MKYKIKNIETGITEEWTSLQALEEINRDRTDEWTKYDETDDIRSAWMEWVEGEGFYSMQE